MMDDLEHEQTYGASYYAVARGPKAGIYNNWADAEKQVKGFSGCEHCKF